MHSDTHQWDVEISEAPPSPNWWWIIAGGGIAAGVIAVLIGRKKYGRI